MTTNGLSHEEYRRRMYGERKQVFYKEGDIVSVRLSDIMADGLNDYPFWVIIKPGDILSKRRSR